MNVLNKIESMGFKITWKLIEIGLYGKEEIPVQLTLEEMFEYLYGCLNGINTQTDNIISLIIERENPSEIANIINKLAGSDKSDTYIQLRKWRAYLLKQLLDNENSNYMQGLLEMLDFWVSMKQLKQCPHVFPDNKGKLSVQNYFTNSMYNLLVEKNRIWLSQEISYIMKEENNESFSSMHDTY